MKNKTINKDVFSLSFFLKIIHKYDQWGAQTCFIVSPKEIQVLGWHWPWPQGHACHIGEAIGLSEGVLS